MIATASLVGAIVFGYLGYQLWYLLPLAVLNTVIGMYTPRDRVQQLRAKGQNVFLFFLVTVPLQGLFLLMLYGLGYGAAYVFAQF